MRDIDDVVAAQHEPALARQRLGVAFQSGRDALAGRFIDTGEDRGLLAETPATIRSPLADSIEQALVVLASGLFDGPVDHGLRLGIDLDADEVEVIGACGLLPNVQRSARGEIVHGVLIARGGALDRLTPFARRHGSVSRCNFDARAEPLQVPFPRSDRDLIEIVEIQDHVALR